MIRIPRFSLMEHSKNSLIAPGEVSTRSVPRKNAGKRRGGRTMCLKSTTTMCSHACSACSAYPENHWISRREVCSSPHHKQRGNMAIRKKILGRHIATTEQGHEMISWRGEQIHQNFLKKQQSASGSDFCHDTVSEWLGVVSLGLPTRACIQRHARPEQL